MLRTYSANNIVYVMYTFFQHMGKEGGILWSVKKKNQNVIAVLMLRRFHPDTHIHVYKMYISSF